MLLSRRSAVVLLATSLLVACGGGAVSVLHARGKPTGEGPARLDVKNGSDVAVERLHVAKTEAVDRARGSGAAPGSDEDTALWGDDQLGNAPIAPGKTFTSLALPEGRYDVLATDHDGREQLVKGLHVKAGGKYVLELRDDWTQAR
jgi:hypothetical protein